MKILFLNDDYPPYSYGGSAVVAERLAKKFATEGHQVFVVSTVQEKDHCYSKYYECHAELVSASRKNINKYEIPKQVRDDIKIYRIYSNYHLRWRAWESMYNYQIIPELRKIMAEIRPDVVHVHNIHTHLSYATLTLARQYSKAVFMTAHDVMLFSYDKFGIDVSADDTNASYNFKMNFWQRLKQAKKRFNPFREWVIRHYMKNVNMIFAISDIQKKALMANGFKRVTTVLNGIDVDNFSVGLGGVNDFRQKYNLHNKKVIFFGGRLSGAKGADLALQYLAETKKQVPNAVLMIAGKQEAYDRSIASLARKMGLEASIVVLGWLDSSELKNAFGVADVCITPSRYFDPFNLFNIEAMAARKPVVGTCFGGAPEIIVDGETGYVVNPLRIQEYAEKIVQLLKDEHKAKQMGERGYIRAKEMFSIEKQYKETLAWYERFA